MDSTSLVAATPIGSIPANSPRSWPSLSALVTTPATTRMRPPSTHPRMMSRPIFPVPKTAAPSRSAVIEAHPHVLYLGVHVEYFPAVFPPPSTHLEAAKGGGRVAVSPSVDPDPSCPQTRGNAKRSVEVAGPEASGQSIPRLVALQDCIVFAIEGDEHHDGTEYLLLGDACQI